MNSPCSTHIGNDCADVAAKLGSSDQHVCAPIAHTPQPQAGPIHGTTQVCRLHRAPAAVATAGTLYSRLPDSTQNITSKQTTAIARTSTFVSLYVLCQLGMLVASRGHTFEFPVHVDRTPAAHTVRFGTLVNGDRPHDVHLYRTTPCYQHPAHTCTCLTTVSKSCRCRLGLTQCRGMPSLPPNVR